MWVWGRGTSSLVAAAGWLDEGDVGPPRSLQGLWGTQASAGQWSVYKALAHRYVVGSELTLRGRWSWLHPIVPTSRCQGGGPA